MATSLGMQGNRAYCNYEEIYQILWTQAASCPSVVVENRGESSAAYVDVLASEKNVSVREERIRERERERAGTRGQDLG